MESKDCEIFDIETRNVEHRLTNENSSADTYIDICARTCEFNHKYYMPTSITTWNPYSKYVFKSGDETLNFNTSSCYGREIAAGNRAYVGYIKPKNDNDYIYNTHCNIQ